MPTVITEDPLRDRRRMIEGSDVDVVKLVLLALMCHDVS